jgi:hypothetical protein
LVLEEKVLSGDRWRRRKGTFVWDRWSGMKGKNSGQKFYGRRRPNFLHGLLQPAARIEKYIFITTASQLV